MEILMPHLSYVELLSAAKILLDGESTPEVLAPFAHHTFPCAQGSW